MKTNFVKEAFFSVPKKEAFTFHERRDAFQLLTPDDYDIEVLSTASTLRPSDDVVRFIQSFLFLKFKFGMIHTAYEPYDLFVDEQKEGLFSSWRHQHRFIECGWDKDPATLMRDQIDFSHPLLFSFKPFVKRQLKTLFNYRHRKTAEELHRPLSSNAAGKKKNVIVTGATGLIGKRIVEIMLEKGIGVTAFVRNPARARQILGDRVVLGSWDFSRPEEGDWRDHLSRADSVIHLAGTPLFKQRWTASFKAEMERSRVESTRQLADAIKDAGSGPTSFITASALGIYGLDPGRTVDENAAPADDLLARICLGWEREARGVDDAGIRSVQLRIGIVLSTESGALKEMKPLFLAGLGGPMGQAHHFINWIHLEDVARMFVMAVFNEEMRGPYNAVAPEPVTMKVFAGALAKALNRPAAISYPESVMKIIIGEAGKYSSGGPRATAAKIQQAGYRFFYESLDPALANALAQ